MAVLPTFPNMSKGQKGRWIFVPAEAWETKPDEYYSMAASSIYLRLAFRLPDQDIKFCMRFGIQPPPTISNKQLPVFVSGARVGVESSIAHPLILGRQIKGCVIPPLEPSRTPGI